MVDRIIIWVRFCFLEVSNSQNFLTEVQHMILILIFCIQLVVSESLTKIPGFIKFPFFFPYEIKQNEPLQDLAGNQYTISLVLEFIHVALHTIHCKAKS